MAHPAVARAQTALAWTRARLELVVAVAAALLSPVAYVTLAGSAASAAVVASSLFAFVAFTAVAARLNPVRVYITTKRRMEAIGGRAFSAFVAYIPTGYVTLALLTWLSPRTFPLLEPVIFRYMVVWPFYLWYVLLCPVPFLPCPVPEAAPATP